jgi:phospho-N-acetylmuramoyl-pentapeptide-transferase
MLYYLFAWLEAQYQPPGLQMFSFITVRASLAAATALVIALFLGNRTIQWLKDHQFNEHIREGEDAGVVSHAHKEGTPTMGGIIILASLLGATLLWGAILEVYVQLAMLVTVWMGVFGFIDDYIKVVKQNKRGLAKQTKIVGQVSLGLLVGGILYFHPNFADLRGLTEVPFLKGRVIDYYFFSGWVPDVDLGWLVYIPLVIFIITAVSNAVNLTDGLDGLAAGTSAFVSLGLVALCYVSGNSQFAEFLDILYLPGVGELTVFTAGLAASCFGFLWYNGYPAQVFMGDTGSLALGGAIGAIALMIRKELWLPLLCGAFFVETLSVILQTTYFKYTRKKYGEGRRLFLMAPLHHHYEAKDIHESKIVIRFWIVTAILVILAVLTLRIR